MTEARSGACMQSGHAIRTTGPVLAAGVGVRRGAGWPLRSASFRLDPSDLGGAALGILTSSQAASTALIDLLAGQIQPDYGTLHILGQDMSEASARSTVRSRIGIARHCARLRPGLRIRGLVEHAARVACHPGHDRHLLVAAILDRLALTPWAEVAVRSAPDPVVRRARIAAAAVHQPDLLLIDGLLDGLPTPDLAFLTDVIHDLERDSALIAAGGDREALMAVCPEVLVLADGILTGARPLASPLAQPQELALAQPTYCD
ncbi:MAG TPA: ATP-binding cassette domain-containing protein [Streptosporangiaceae bacterium]|nr:ATP-binding cassette domain-containing protein [Streptosporangiaceae bacterium]